MLNVILFCIAFLVSSHHVIASSSGVKGLLFQSSPGCGGCHGGRSSSTIVSIISKSNSFTVQPGAMAEFTAIVAHPTKAGAGINIGVKKSTTENVNIGSLAVITGQKLRLDQSSRELTHSSPKDMSNGKAEFNFTWTAPMQEGVYYLLATGNAVNRNGGDSGDEWNFMTPIELTVSSSTSVDEIPDMQSLSVFPNPIEELSMFQFTVRKATELRYSISNMMGQTVFSQYLGLKEEGTHSVHFLGLFSLLSSGHYVISLQTPEGVQTIPFIKQ